MKPRIIIFSSLLVVFVALSAILNLPEWIAKWVVDINTWGILGILLFILLYISTTVLMIPGSLLTLAAGFIFGFGKGLIATVIAANVGAAAAFFIGRYLARDWALHLAQRYSFFKALDSAISDEGWKMVALLRLSPIVPFNLINYILGLTAVSPLAYLSASPLCMLPGTIVFVYLGSLANSLTEALSGQESYTPLQWALLSVGLVATFLMSLWIARIAHRTLHTKIEDQPPDTPPI